MLPGHLFTLCLAAATINLFLALPIPAQEQSQTSGWNNVLSLIPGTRVKLGGAARKDSVSGQVVWRCIGLDHTSDDAQSGGLVISLLRS